MEFGMTANAKFVALFYIHIKSHRMNDTLPLYSFRINNDGQTELPIIVFYPYLFIA